MDDTAVYECSVSNDAGEDQRAIDLTVQGRGDIAVTCVCGTQNFFGVFQC